MNIQQTGVTLIGVRIRRGLTPAIETLNNHYEFDLATRCANGSHGAMGVFNRTTIPAARSTIDQHKGSVSPDAWTRQTATVSKKKGKQHGNSTDRSSGSAPARRRWLGLFSLAQIAPSSQKRLPGLEPRWQSRNRAMTSTE
jgi:hypothetical protein